MRLLRLVTVVSAVAMLGIVGGAESGSVNLACMCAALVVLGLIAALSVALTGWREMEARRCATAMRRDGAGSHGKPRVTH